MCSEDDLQEDGFSERFKFDSTPPRRTVLPQTPSLEDSEFSSSAATMNARVIEDEDDDTLPLPTSARIDTAPSSSAPPNNTDDLAASPTPHGIE